MTSSVNGEFLLALAGGGVGVLFISSTPAPISAVLEGSCGGVGVLFISSTPAQISALLEDFCVGVAAVETGMGVRL